MAAISVILFRLENYFEQNFTHEDALKALKDSSLEGLH